MLMCNFEIGDIARCNKINSKSFFMFSLKKPVSLKKKQLHCFFNGFFSTLQPTKVMLPSMMQLCKT